MMVGATDPSVIEAALTDRSVKVEDEGHVDHRDCLCLAQPDLDEEAPFGFGHGSDPQ